MSQKSTVFFNPKFKNIHVNPNFLQQSSKVQVNQSNPIHVNPKFFMAFESSASFKPPLPDEPPVKPPLPPAPTNAIIRNTRRTWVRASSTSRPNVAVPPAEANQLPQQTLIKISKNRLVTAAHLMKCQQKENEIIKNTTNSIIKTKKLQRRSEKPESLYKVDRRNPKKKVISTYSIRRVSPMKWDGLKTLVYTLKIRERNKSLKLFSVVTIWSTSAVFCTIQQTQSS